MDQEKKQFLFFLLLEWIEGENRNFVIARHINDGICVHLLTHKVVELKRNIHCNENKILSNSFSAESRNYSFIIPVIRILLLKYHDMLPLTIYMPGFSAADRVSQQAQEDFLELMESEEFKALMKQQIYPGMKQYETTL